MKKFLILLLTLSLYCFSYSSENLTEKQKLQIFKNRLIKSLQEEIEIKKELIKCLDKVEKKEELKKCFEEYAKKMKPIWLKKKKYWEKYQKKIKKEK